MKRLLIAAVVLCALAPRGMQAAPLRSRLLAGVLDAAQPASPDTETVIRDTVTRIEPRVSVDSILVHDGRGEHWPSPTATLVKSMVVPGWGQISNRRYFKASLAIGLESWFIYGVASEWSKMSDALDRLRADPDDAFAFAEYDFHRGNRADYLWALGLTVFISMFDAYVDAHLRPYEEDTIPEVQPPPGVAVVLVRF